MFYEFSKDEIREKSEAEKFLRDCNPIVKLAVSNETQPGMECDLAAVNFLRDRNETHILKDSDGQEKSGKQTHFDKHSEVASQENSRPKKY